MLQLPPGVVLQAFRAKARAANDSGQAAEADAAAAAVSAGDGYERAGSLGEGRSSSVAGEEGSASDGGSSSSGEGSGEATGSNGSDSEGSSGGSPVEGQRHQARGATEDAWRREFVEPYQQIVWEVLDSMLLVRRCLGGASGGVQ